MQRGGFQKKASCEPSAEQKRLMRANVRRSKQWEESPEGIHYDTDIRDCVLPKGDTDHVSLIIQVLSRLPARIRGTVQSNATFITTYGESTVTHGTGKWIVLLAFKERQGDKDKRLTIAHEIGHLLDYLKNPQGSGGREAETRADDFAERYGFGRAYTKKQLLSFSACHEMNGATKKRQTSAR